ncbi:hypothetical protein FOA43_003179 [Brettanomyces nanus]|uniref:Uncharacterized protein n=1 Tax=Eeniella nana TaxID=13502 RepID=A0A875RVU0_EENNA|nr:uncharacterized protein FOA43_003179 [Brettanomyces nanus]QPG75817.1 hypothetical protein FOA43_003179 [Brettanomyces nanus]
MPVSEEVEKQSRLIQESHNLLCHSSTESTTRHGFRKTNIKPKVTKDGTPLEFLFVDCNSTNQSSVGEEASHDKKKNKKKKKKKSTMSMLGKSKKSKNTHDAGPDSSCFSSSSSTLSELATINGSLQELPETEKEEEKPPGRVTRLFRNRSLRKRRHEIDPLVRSSQPSSSSKRSILRQLYSRKSRPEKIVRPSLAVRTSLEENDSSPTTSETTPTQSSSTASSTMFSVRTPNPSISSNVLTPITPIVSTTSSLASMGSAANYKQQQQQQQQQQQMVFANSPLTHTPSQQHQDEDDYSLLEVCSVNTSNTKKIKAFRRSNSIVSMASTCSISQFPPTSPAVTSTAVNNAVRPRGRVQSCSSAHSFGGAVTRTLVSQPVKFRSASHISLSPQSQELASGSADTWSLEPRKMSESQVRQQHLQYQLQELQQQMSFQRQSWRQQRLKAQSQISPVSATIAYEVPESTEKLYFEKFSKETPGDSYMISPGQTLSMTSSAPTAPESSTIPVIPVMPMMPIAQSEPMSWMDSTPPTLTASPQQSTPFDFPEETSKELSTCGVDDTHPNISEEELDRLLKDAFGLDMGPKEPSTNESFSVTDLEDQNFDLLAFIDSAKPSK